jgi:adenylate cyclase
VIERERRYLVNRSSLPVNGVVLGEGDSIIQGYLVADGDLAIRVRQRGSMSGVQNVPEVGPAVATRSSSRSSTLTIKAPISDSDRAVSAVGSGSAQRREVEIPITVDQADELWEMCGQRIIAKSRHLVPIDGGLTAEVDVFAGRWTGLVMVEVEFDDHQSLTDFVPPAWFGPEVTFDPRFTNAGLATASLPVESDLRQIIQAECGTGE